MSETEQAVSTGISDQATRQTVVVENDKLTIRSDVKIFGVLDVSEVRTSEIYAHKKYDKQFLEFANKDGEAVGAGLVWTGGDRNRMMVFHQNPNRFFFSENLDLSNDKAYLISGAPVLNSTELGKTVTVSNLQRLGTLKNLAVGGEVNIGDVIFFNPVSERLGVGIADANGVLSVYDAANDVELIFSGNADGRGVVGTFTTKGLDIVTDNKARITISASGEVTVHSNSTVHGTLAVDGNLEVAGNIRFAGKLFATADNLPSSGTYGKGDVVWNSNPKAQAYIGWVCTQGGTPGQWRPFGQIA